ncbi:MAG: HAMP domain-containing histidine kinase [Bacteroidetes bacterium]|nr:HAMP domain-containing histidine kinase [Bacteroidota bacterium]
MDNGIGIKEENRAKIFEPNFTTKNSGTGLGMAITKKVIDNAGGIIYFDTKMDVGTNFYIELPIYTGDIE